MTSEALAGGRYQWLTGAPIGPHMGAIRMGGRHGSEHYRTTFFWVLLLWLEILTRYWHWIYCNICPDGPQRGNEGETIGICDSDILYLVSKEAFIPARWLGGGSWRTAEERRVGLAYGQWDRWQSDCSGGDTTWAGGVLGERELVMDA
jgi:hypothetical protein